MKKPIEDWKEQLLEAYMIGWIHAQPFPLKKPYGGTSFYRMQFTHWLERRFPEMQMSTMETERWFEKAFDNCLNTINNLPA